MNEKGFSLIEIMVAAALTGILTLLIGNVFIISRHNFSLQQDVAQTQEAGQLAINFLAKDLRMAGMYGCAKPSSSPFFDVRTQSTTNHRFMDASPIVGFINSSAVPPNHDLVHHYSQDSDVIQIQRIAYQAFDFLGFDANGALLVAVNSTARLSGKCLGGICVGQSAIISNCEKSIAFTVANLSLMNHGSNTVLVVVPTASFNALGDFIVDFAYADVMGVDWVGYFVAKGSSGQPSLWQKNPRESAFEIMEGVEQLLIGYKKSNGSQFHKASALSGDDWHLIESIRVEVVVRGTVENSLSEVQPYHVSGQKVVPEDGYYRQTYTTHVSLRGADQ